MEKTLMIIKPDAVEAGYVGEILLAALKADLRITALRLLTLSREQAEEFYAVHREKPFFASLVAYMTSGPVVVGRIEGENVVERWRKLIGATDPKKAEPGTIRHRFGVNIERNAVHGSDSIANGEIETRFFFP